MKKEKSLKEPLSVKEIITELKKHGKEKNRIGMARFGINIDKAFGVNIPFIRALAKKIGKNHILALKLWESGYHEARLLASMIDEPKSVTKSQMNKWVKDFNSWDICDQTCSNLFSKTSFAIEKIFSWSKRKEEYIRRASFTLIACLAVHDKGMSNDSFIQFFSLIKKYSTDERNFVKKAVNWAIRQIGKRNKFLNTEALKLAEEIKNINSKSARWIAMDAIRELKNCKKHTVFD